MKLLRLLVLPLVALSAIAASAEVTVFAAASLSDALKEIAADYEPASGDHLRFNLAASSALARQIKEGAPADVFFSADEAKMDDLAKAGLIVAETRASLLSNSLALVIPVDSKLVIASAADLAASTVRKIALAETQTVPAGIYAKEYLEKLGLWEKISTKVIPTENVRACLAAVESGNVDTGIVYKTDALISKKVRIAFAVPVSEGPKISYPLAVVKASKNAEAAGKFVTYLASPKARAVFEKYGFTSVP